MANPEDDMRFRAWRWLWLPGVMMSMLGACTALPSENDELVAIYSRFCWHAEAGDLLGERILLFQDAPLSKRYVVFQEAEGVPTQPEGVPASIGNGTIQFEVFANAPKPLRFTGTITPDAITGRFDGTGDGPFGGALLQFPRQRNEMKRAPDCRAEP